MIGSFSRMLATSLLLAPALASAQSLAAYGSLEATGYGEGSAYVGSTLSAGGAGWSPYVAIGAYSFRYRSGSGHDIQTGIAPSIGLAHSGATQMVSFGVGYNILSSNAPAVTTSGAPVGSSESPFVTGQYSYWGDGSKDVNLLGTYATKAKYYWTRASALSRLGGTEGRLFAGGEVGLQGSSEPTSFSRISVGPAISYRVSDMFRIGGAAGARFATGTNAPPVSGYARLDFLLTPPRVR